MGLFIFVLFGLAMAEFINFSEKLITKQIRHLDEINEQSATEQSLSKIKLIKTLAQV
jgi:hypothetical protein